MEKARSDENIFLGHSSDLEVGQKKPIKQKNDTQIILKNHEGYKISSNVCPHQGSMIICSKQQVLKCQYHGWEWDDLGNPIVSENTAVCNRFKLKFKNLFEEKSLIFKKKINLEIIKTELSFMRLVDERTDVVNSNFENIIDVFLDIDHIPVVHKNVYDEIGITNTSNIFWNYYDWGNVQTVNKNSEVSLDFKKTLLEDENLDVAAYWICLYPYTMIEIQQGSMFITVCNPKKDFTEVCVFKYRDIRYDIENYNINSAIWEKAWSQDKNQSEKIIKPFRWHKNLEQAKIHFRQWIKKNNFRCSLNLK